MMKKKYFSLCFIFLAVAFFITCSFRDNNVTKGVLPPREAEYFASNAIDKFYRINPGGEFSNWLGATYGNAVIVKDIEDNPVLYDVPVVKDGENIGVVQVLADDTLKMPLYTVSASTILLEYSLHLEDAQSAVMDYINDAPLSNPGIIYYNFPKRAFVFNLEINGKHNVLVDVETLEIVPEEKIVPYRKMKPVNPNTETGRIDEIRFEQTKNVASVRDTAVNGEVTYRNLPVPLIPQVLHGSCVGASIQMIWTYERPEDVKHQIDILNRIPGCDPRNGCISNAYIDDYLVGNGFTSSFIGNKADCQTIIQEIENNNPYISIIPIPNHARVATGYFYDETFGFWVHINDPAPVNEGNQYWKNWENSTEVAHIKMAYNAHTSPGVPDLFCSSIVRSGVSFFAGDLCVFKAKIKNIGSGSVTGIPICWYVDNDIKETDTIDTTLVSGETMESAFTWTSYPVEHKIMCSLDPKNVIRESNEENNTADVHIYVSYGTRPQDPTPVPSLPDLVIDEIHVPSNMISGSEYAFTATISNTGNEYTGGVYVKWYIDGLLNKTTLIGSVFPSGGSQQTSFTWVAYHGTHKVRIEVDPDNYITESDEGNNSKESESFSVITIPEPVNTTPPPEEVTPTPTPSRFPDLECSGITIPSNMISGNTYTFTADVFNVGLAYTGGIKVTCYMDGTLFGTHMINTAIAPGASQSVSFSFLVYYGDHTIRLVVDPENTIEESNEDNNTCQSSLFHVSNPPVVTSAPTAPPPPPTVILSCSGISGPSTVYMGKTYSYSVTINNSGNSSSGSFTVTWSVDGASKSSSSMSLAAGGSASRSFSWTANTGRGNHTIRVSINSSSCASMNIFADMAP